MDRKFQIRANILICVIIFIGFAAVGFTSYDTYSHIISDDIVNISKLTSTNIYSDIRNELTKPIFVSLTMANDSFLKNWLLDEQSGNSVAHQEALREYLLGFRKKYHYDSVFLISEKSKAYYHYNGINKVISPDDEHDKWYYDFRDSGYSYDLDVDTDEANHNRLSVFVNCRVTDENGSLLGVTGVGLEMDHVQGLLKAFEDDYALEAMLFNEEGVVQVHTRADSIEKTNIFDNGILKENRQKITDNRDSLVVFEYRQEPFNGYYITRYIEDLNWYLLVKKDTSVLEETMYDQIGRDVIIYAIVAACVLVIANSIIRKNDKLMMSMTKTDLLTGLLNRRGFNERLEKVIGEEADGKPFYVFVFDIDNFKKVNDSHGHLIGDKVLREIGQLALAVFSDTGMISRWGGDEFAGYITGERTDVISVVERFFKRVQQEPAFELYRTTVSMGITRAHKIDNADTLIYRADQALYEAKGSGKNRYRIIDGPPRGEDTEPS